ncbi:hypothetical protein C8J57DRAFT_1234790 [Mycena rebaudengoi]|nr:hypothetical protein C8J57DRAFT_1234790 [Mycena rebaudengoi]
MTHGRLQSAHDFGTAVAGGHYAAGVVGSKIHGEGDARTWREWNMKFEPPELLRYLGEKRNEKGQRWRMDSEVYIWMTRTIAMQAFSSWQVDRREQVDSSGVFETLIVFAISSQAESLSVGTECLELLGF